MDDISAGIIGWLGTLGTFGAYALLWRGRVDPASRIYAAMNTLGGLLGAVAGALYGAWPSVASNAVWAAVGLHTLIVVSLRSHTAPSRTSFDAGRDVSQEGYAVPAMEVVTGAIDVLRRHGDAPLGVPLPVPASATVGLHQLTPALGTSSIPLPRVPGPARSR